MNNLEKKLTKSIREGHPIATDIKPLAKKILKNSF